eukprot:CAMPEP_0185599606 /NCGR_PEP_ID=MMETSP0434-20130131/82821_1 /TAXON_ID=626734 ORGANISM="Favella taraikaensis, Strain Fe Narragansett Bay" /NCGR_SAMPLE_ID=MMETSP0434 /ASSEMBLY_ACC=CAM_ASM_000379 /LENGTH=114 /DNA_ID=CAMNT_0028229067 /DNA_START=825 /DNA_END=1169 /DNA_ORIENTATION=-
MTLKVVSEDQIDSNPASSAYFRGSQSTESSPSQLIISPSSACQVTFNTASDSLLKPRDSSKLLENHFRRYVEEELDRQDIAERVELLAQEDNEADRERVRHTEVPRYGGMTVSF